MAPLVTPMGESLRDLLAANRDQIVARFVDEVRGKELSPSGLPRSLLVDHIPTFLEEIIAELDKVSSVRFTHDAIDTSQTARRHGEQRWSLGYDLEAVVREYGVLRHVILEVAKLTGPTISIDEVDVLAKCLNVGVAQATSEYVRYRDEQVEAERANVEFLAQAGELLSSSLDYRSTLTRLTELVVPRLADWCAVHVDGVSVDEMPIAHVDPAKASLVREVYQRYPLPEDSPVGYPAVIRTGEPQLMRSIEPGLNERIAASPEHLALLRSINACSWLVVPLRIQGSRFGAITFAYSDSERQYGDKDVLLALELARRAAVAIDNARLYDQSQKARSRVEAATRVKDEFVAMVSHELRAPLNSILGWAVLLRDGTLDAAKAAHAVEVIERSARTQDRLVTDLLDISAAVSGKSRMNLGEVDLAVVVGLAVEAVRPAAEAKNIQIEIDVAENASDEGLIIRADGDRLQQVVWNLLSNSVKFSARHGRVAIRLARIGSEVEVTVTDDGPGIPSEFLPHVFESFRQYDASSTRAHGGLGIGLSIAKHLTELHGGTIEARSDGPGQGATFSVRLPVNPPARTGLISVRVPAVQGSGLPNLLTDARGIKVLVLDDDPDARELVKEGLETSGIVVTTAESAADALRQLQLFSPDVLISDIGMPQMDGYAFIRTVRTLSAKEKDTPAIALTAFAGHEDRARALVEGYNVHMAKPVDLAALTKAVLNLVGRGRKS